jgi:hypothetical protein
MYCRAFRRKDGEMIANFRVQADLKGMETTTDGRWEFYWKVTQRSKEVTSTSNSFDKTVNRSKFKNLDTIQF